MEKLIYIDAPVGFETTHPFEFYCAKNPPKECECRNDKLYIFHNSREKQIPLNINELYSILKFLHGDSHVKVSQLQQFFNKNYYINDDLEKITKQFISLCEDNGCRSYTKTYINNKRKNEECSLVTFESPTKSIKTNNFLSNCITNYDADCKTTKEIYTHYDLLQFIGNGPHYNIYYKYVSSLGSLSPVYPYTIVVDEQSAVSLLHDEKNNIQQTLGMLNRGILSERAIDFCLFKGMVFFEEKRKQSNKNFICLSSSIYKEIYYYFNCNCNFETSANTANIFKNKDGSINELIIFPISANNHISLVAIYTSLCKTTNKIKIDLCLHIDCVEKSSHTYTELDPRLLCMLECCKMLMLVERNCFYKRNVNWQLIKKFLIVQLMVENGESVDFIDFSKPQSNNYLRLRDFTIASITLQPDNPGSFDCGSIFVRNYYLLLHSFYNTSNYIVISVMDSLRENYKSAKLQFTFFQNEYLNLANEIINAVKKFCFIQEKIKNENVIAGFLSDLKKEGLCFPENVEFEFNIQNKKTNTTYSWYLQSNSFILSVNSTFDYELGTIKKARLNDSNLKNGDGSLFSKNILFYFNRTENKLYYTEVDLYRELSSEPNVIQNLFGDYHFIALSNKKFRISKTYSTFKLFYERFYESVQQLNKNNSTQSLQLYTSDIFNLKTPNSEYIIDINTNNHSNLFQICDPPEVAYSTSNYSLSLEQWKYISSEIRKKHLKDGEIIPITAIKSPFVSSKTEEATNKETFTPMPIEINNKETLVQNNQNFINANENINVLTNENEILAGRIRSLLLDKEYMSRQLEKLNSDYNILFMKNKTYKQRNAEVSNITSPNLKNEILQTSLVRAAKDELQTAVVEISKLKEMLKQSNEHNNVLTATLTLANDLLREKNIQNNTSIEKLNLSNCQYFINLIIKSIKDNKELLSKIFYEQPEINYQCDSFLNDLNYLATAMKSLKSTIKNKIATSGLKFNDDQINYLNGFFLIQLDEYKSPNIDKLNKELINSPNNSNLQQIDQAHSDSLVSPIKRPSPVTSNIGTMFNTHLDHYILVVKIAETLTYYITTLELATYFPENYNNIFPDSITLLENIDNMKKFSSDSVRYYEGMGDLTKTINGEIDLKTKLLPINYKNYPFLKNAELQQLSHTTDVSTCNYFFQKGLERAKYFDFAFGEILKEPSVASFLKAVCYLCNEPITGDNSYYKCCKRNCPNVICHSCFDQNKSNSKNAYDTALHCPNCFDKCIKGIECARCNNSRDLNTCLLKVESGDPCQLKLCSDCSKICPNINHFKIN